MIKDKVKLLNILRIISILCIAILPFTAVFTLFFFLCYALTLIYENKADIVQNLISETLTSIYILGAIFYLYKIYSYYTLSFIVLALEFLIQAIKLMYCSKTGFILQDKAAIGKNLGGLFLIYIISVMTQQTKNIYILILVYLIFCNIYIAYNIINKTKGV